MVKGKVFMDNGEWLIIHRNKPSLVLPVGLIVNIPEEGKDYIKKQGKLIKEIK